MMGSSEHYGTVMMIEDKYNQAVVYCCCWIFCWIILCSHGVNTLAYIYTTDLLARHYTKPPMAVPGMLEEPNKYILIYPCQPGQYSMAGYRVLSVNCKNSNLATNVYCFNLRLFVRHTHPWHYSYGLWAVCLHMCRYSSHSVLNISYLMSPSL